MKVHVVLVLPWPWAT